MRNELEILQLTTDFGQGGAEKVFSQLGEALATKYTVTDCVFNQVYQREYHSGNKVVDLKTQPTRNYPKKVLNFFLRIWRLQKIKRALDIDVSISHLEGADYINILSRQGEKVIVCVHGSKLHDKDIRGAGGWVRKKILIPFLYQKADLIVTVSHDIKAELVRGFGLSEKSVHVINNFFDSNTLNEKSNEPLPPDYARMMSNYNVLISVGRLVDQKNHRLLIEFMPDLLEEKPDVKLLILGEGYLYDELLESAKGLGLSVQKKNAEFNEHNHVFFLGYLSNPYHFLRHSKIFLMPSLWEGFPLSLCEAMFCGAAVIAHDCPTGPKEIIAPHLSTDIPLTKSIITKLGVLIPLTDSNKSLWVESIISLLSDNELRKDLTIEARQHIQSYDKERIVDKWFSLIDNIIKG
jgi:glycosyltransferase involved in cell wall biosynthesis